jgi:hypothetical protein
VNSRAFNQRLDAKLSALGEVDKDLFVEFVSVHGDLNATSHGWLQAKLRVLARRVESRQPLYLYEPSSQSGLQVNTLAAFMAWVSRNFPDAEQGL